MKLFLVQSKFYGSLHVIATNVRGAEQKWRAELKRRMEVWSKEEGEPVDKESIPGDCDEIKLIADDVVL